MVTLFLFQMTLSGCAVNYIDDEGVKHVVGIVNMQIKPFTTVDRSVIESVHIQTVGFLVYSTAIQRGIALGYSSEHLATVYDNVVVGNPAAIFPREK